MNAFLRFLKSIWIKVTNYLPFVKEYRAEKNKEETKEQFQTMKEKIDNSKENKKEEILIKQLLDKKVLDKKRLIEDIKGKHYLLIVFAIPSLPKILNDEIQKKVSDYLRGKKEKKGLSGRRNYTSFLVDELRFKKLGSRYSTTFFIRLKDLPIKYRKVSKLKSYLEKELIKIQKEEWDLVVKILNESKAQTIIQYKEKLLEKGFEDSYNISFYLDYITFKKENVFAQNENSLLLSQLLTFEDIIGNRKNLESIRENLDCFDISLLFTNSLSIEIKSILEKEQNNIKDNLDIKNIFEEINKEDLRNQLKIYLEEDYEEKITNSLYKKQTDFRNFLVNKGVIN